MRKIWQKVLSAVKKCTASTPIDKHSKCAEEKNAQGQSDLGLTQGKCQVIYKDSNEPVKLSSHKSPEQSGVIEQFNLGIAYSKGLGVRQDKNEAVSWFSKAAEQGDAMAQTNLGAMYYNGDGVSQNKLEAVKWFSKAAEQGDAKAQFNLGIMYYDGDGVSQDKAEAIKWFSKAAEQGNADAQFTLGVMYASGDSVKEDYPEAIKWLQKASKQGHREAKEKLLQIALIQKMLVQFDTTLNELGY